MFGDRSMQRFDVDAFIFGCYKKQETVCLVSNSKSTLHNNILDKSLPHLELKGRTFAGFSSFSHQLVERKQNYPTLDYHHNHA